MTPHNKFLEFLDTVETEQTEVVIESAPGTHWISKIEVNGEGAKLLQLDDIYLFIFNGEAQVLNVKQYNAVAESFKKVMEFLQGKG